MKQTEPREVTISGTKFYIRPFPAFKAANLTGELASLLTPILTSLVPFINTGTEGDTNGLMDIDIGKAAPNIAGAFSGISGEKVELLLRKLLLQNKNIAVEVENESGESDAETLTEDIVNEIFCGEVQDTFLLAFEVIRLNFNGFFKKIVGRFGKASDTAEKKRTIL